MQIKTLKLLTRRYTSLNTKRIVASSKVLHDCIPTHNCDVIMTLPAKTDDVTLMWLLSRLRSRSPQILVYVRHWKNTGMYAFYMTANFDSLLKGAEMLGICKPLKSAYGGEKREFVYEDQLCYLGVEDQTQFFTSEERQRIVYHLLLNLRAGSNECLEKVKFLEGQAIVPLLQSKGIISQVFPLHEKESLNVLQKSWVQTFSVKQPLEKIQEYFGVKIAMYFAYLGHYTWALTAPTFLGVVFWFVQSKNHWLDDFCFVTFALFNVLWASLYTENWRRKSAELAYQWGTLDKSDELLQDPRPLYTGHLVVSPVTGRLEPHYAAWKRNIFRYFVTVPVIGFCLLIVFYWMLLVFELQEWVNGLVKNGDIPSFCQFLPKILLAASIGILDEIYKKIATWLNDQENYRMDETYENHLIIKLVLFQFVNSFLSLFYIAFYLQDMDRLRDQLATLLITRQVIGNLREAVLPWLLWKIRLMKVGYTITGHMSPQTLEREVQGLGLSTPWSLLTEESAESGEEIFEDTQDKPDTTTDDDRSKTDELGISGAIAEIKKAGWSSEDEDTSGKPVSEGSGVKTDKPGTRDDGTCLQELPAGIDWSQARRSSGVKGSELTLSQAEVESTMKRYEDTFDDYLEMFIQYGYVILFSSAFPLAALCALLNNVIEIHSDAFKLCVYHQRPFGKRVQNIGIWQDALRVMGLVAVVVNSALIGVSGQVTRMYPDLDSSSTIVFILVLEHIILVLKMLIMKAIPSQPEWIQQEMARLEFQRREALKSLESHLTSPAAAHMSQTSSVCSDPASVSSVNLSTTVPPAVPARHHTSDLSLLRQSDESFIRKEDIQTLDQADFETQSLSSPLSDRRGCLQDQSPTCSDLCSSLHRPKDLRFRSDGTHSVVSSKLLPESPTFSSSHQTVSQSNIVRASDKGASVQKSVISSCHISDGTDSVLNKDRNISKSLGSKTVTFKEKSAQHKIPPEGHARDVPCASQRSVSMETAYPGSHGLYHRMSESEARLQTRQRILQSAKLRQNKESKSGDLS